MKIASSCQKDLHTEALIHIDVAYLFYLMTEAGIGIEGSGIGIANHGIAKSENAGIGIAKSELTPGLVLFKKQTNKLHVYISEYR